MIDEIGWLDLWRKDSYVSLEGIKPVIVQKYRNEPKGIGTSLKGYRNKPKEV